MVEAPDSVASRARVAGAIAYGAQGTCFAALVARIPTLQDRFELSDTALAGLLALVPLIAGVGSVVAGALISRVGTSLPLGLFFLAVAIVVIPAQLLAGPRLLRGQVEIDGTIDDVSIEHPNRALVRVPWRPITIIGIALAAVYVADSAASNWSAVYLTDALDSTETVAALAYAFYASTTLIARLVVDRGVMACGPVVLVRLGGGIAVVAAVLVAIAPTPAIGLAAFALLGLGVAPVIPLAFSAAAQHDPLGTGVAVARVNVFNYVGFVLGAPLIGIASDLSSLRWAFAVLVPVLLVVVLLAPAFRVRSRG